MKKIIIICLIALQSSNLKAQFNFTPITQLITDSISVIGQSGLSVLNQTGAIS